MLLLTPPPPPLLVVLLLLVVVVEVVLGSTLPPLFGILTVLMRERNAGYDLSSFIDFLSLSLWCDWAIRVTERGWGNVRFSCLNLKRLVSGL